jgi:hypothetical protein
MRCYNCGWKNLSGNKKCEKCNAILEEEVVNDLQIDNSLEKGETSTLYIDDKQKNKSVFTSLKTLKIDE